MTNINLLVLLLILTQARGADSCFHWTTEPGTITIVHLTSSINVTSMEIRCAINGTTALTWLSPCEMKRLLIGHGLVDNEPFCLTLNLNCSVSVTMANNSNMKSTLRCYSNTGWPNFNGTIVSCLSDGSAKCSIELWAMASSTTTISPSQPTSDGCAGCIVGSIIAITVLVICFIISVVGIKRWALAIKNCLLNHMKVNEQAPLESSGKYS